MIHRFIAATLLTTLLAGCGSSPAIFSSTFSPSGESRVGASTLKAGQIKVIPVDQNKATASLSNFQEGVLLATFTGSNGDHQLRYAASLASPTLTPAGPESLSTFATIPRRRSVTAIRRSRLSQARALFDEWLDRRARSLAHRLQGRKKPGHKPQLEERQYFYVSEKIGNKGNDSDFKRVRYPARLKAITSHAYFFVDERYLNPDMSLPFAGDFAQVVKYFEETAVPVDTRTFGDYPQPPNDVDGDPRVTVLFTKMYEGVVGYFDPTDSSTEEPESNQRDMLYAGADTFKDQDGERTVESTLIHELVHMIVFNQKGLKRPGKELDEAKFVDEGLAVVAEQLGGLGMASQEPVSVNYIFEFLQDNPSAQLTDEGEDYLYGTGYLFVLYLMEQYGPEILRKLVQSDKVGIANVEAAVGRPFAKIFRDWAITLVASGHSDDARYNFKSVNLRGTYGGKPLNGLNLTSFNDFPVNESVTTKSWSIIPIRFKAPSAGSALTLNLVGDAGGAGKDLEATLLDTSTLQDK